MRVTIVCPPTMAIRHRHVVAAIVLFVAACASPESSFPPPSAPRIPNAPAEVVSRAPLPYCGSEDVSQEETGFNVEARLCFWSAYESYRSAEFISRRATVEGDPIIEIFRIRTGPVVEIFLDSTRDRWSARTWLRLDCGGLVLVPDRPVQPYFTGSRCNEVTLTSP